jgi:predicted RNA-binding protein YlxR (DUF448 family)
MKKIPLRRCIATMTQVPKKELLRIVRTPDGEVKIDLTGKVNGRGAYLLKTLEAVELAQKKGALSRALECQIPNEIYDEIRKLINDAK